MIWYVRGDMTIYGNANSISPRWTFSAGPWEAMDASVEVGGCLKNSYYVEWECCNVVYNVLPIYS